MTSYLKAIVGGLVPFLTTLQANANDGLTTSEWITALIAGLIGLGAVWKVPNLDPKGKRQRESVMPPDGE